MNITTRIFMTGLLATLLAGCGAIDTIKEDFLPNKDKVDYRKAKEISTLEVPPDLTSSTIDDGLIVPDIAPNGSANLSDYNRERKGQARSIRTSTVLPDQVDVRVQRDQSTRWLVINGSPAQVWPRMREFWAQNGFLVKRENPQIGILETDWAENRADIPKDFITRQISKVFDGIYSSATRDKFRVRLEDGLDAGTTELYVTHRGAEEVESENTDGLVIWRPRQADPELEIEMLRRLSVHFGIEEEKSQNLFASKSRNRVDRAELNRDGSGATSLRVKEGFARAWRRTGLALDRVGFTVEDRDRSRGVYFVRYVDPLKDSNTKKEGGILSTITFGVFDGKDNIQEKTTYQVSLAEQSTETEVTVLDKQGQVEKSGTALRILTLLHEQLK